MWTSTFRPAVFCVVAALLAGCGGGGDVPDLGSVTGKVMLDGQPLAGASVTFSPANGRPSNAETNEDGTYELMYLNGVSGAVVGEHTVSISTYKEKEFGDDEEPDESEKDGEEIESVETPEKIPVVFNQKSTLKKTVEAGSNEIDLDLKSDAGEIFQPGEMPIEEEEEDEDEE